MGAERGHQRQGSDPRDGRRIDEQEGCGQVAGLGHPFAAAPAPAGGLANGGDPQIAGIAGARRRERRGVRRSGLGKSQAAMSRKPGDRLDRLPEEARQ
jgi:hypothetical protein